MKKLILFVLTLVSFKLTLAQEIRTGLHSMEPQQYAAFPSTFPSTPTDKLPIRVDLSQTMPPVGNQHPQNSCVAWAIAYAGQGYYAKSNFNNWSFVTSMGQPNFSNLFSPSYVYNQINNSVDEGSNYEVALRLMKEQGVSTLSTMGYVHYLQQPSPQAKNEATNYRIKSYRRLGEVMNPLLDAKDQLAKGHPVIINAKTDLTYFQAGFNSNRQVPYIWRQIGRIDPRMNHALLLVGYDDNYGAFKFINSWGTNWGDNGYGWISYNIYNSVVPQSWIIIPSFGESVEPNRVVYSEKSTIDQTDRANGLNLFLTNVTHMNSNTHPHIHFNDRYMRVMGNLSIPVNSGQSANVVIYFYHLNSDGSKGAAIRSVTPSMSLPNGNIIAYTPPLSLNNYSIINLAWFTDIKYIAFDLPRGFNPPYSRTPITHRILAEPALLIDNYPVRKGQRFEFVIVQ